MPDGQHADDPFRRIAIALRIRWLDWLRCRLWRRFQVTHAREDLRALKRCAARLAEAKRRACA